MSKKEGKAAQRWGTFDGIGGTKIGGWLNVFRGEHHGRKKIVVCSAPTRKRGVHGIPTRLGQESMDGATVGGRIIFERRINRKPLQFVASEKNSE